MTTSRDHVVIDFDVVPLLNRAKTFRDSTLTNSELCILLNIPEKKGWNIAKARSQIQKENDLKAYIKPVLYRPFDERLIFYHDSLVWRTVKQVMSHMLIDMNLSLSFHRREELDIPYSHFFATRCITEHGLLSSKTTNYQAPLYLYPDTLKQQNFANTHVWPIDKKGRIPNLSKDFVKAIEEIIKLRFDPYSNGGDTLFTPKDVFNYIYAVIYSLTYRTRYAEFLKIDFPRVPWTSNLELFRSLAKLGGELVALHLMESNKVNDFITRFTGKGDNSIPKKPMWKDNAVWINQIQHFEGVPENVWNFHIGGYQVCEKWLKDRKGRTLSADDITHYQRIVVALTETIRIMAEIDRVIDEHGGWPIK